MRRPDSPVPAKIAQRLVIEPASPDAIGTALVMHPGHFASWAVRLLACAGSTSRMRDLLIRSPGQIGGIRVVHIRRWIAEACRATGHRREAAALAVLTIAGHHTAHQGIRRLFDLVIVVGLLDALARKNTAFAMILTAALRARGRDGVENQFHNALALAGFEDALPSVARLLLWVGGWPRLARALRPVPFEAGEIGRHAQWQAVSRTIDLLSHDVVQSIIPVTVARDRLVEAGVRFYADELMNRLARDAPLSRFDAAIGEDVRLAAGSSELAQVRPFAISEITLRFLRDPSRAATIPREFEQVRPYLQLLQRIDPRDTGHYRELVARGPVEYFGYRRDPRTGSVEAVVRETPLPAPAHHDRRNSDPVHLIDLPDAIVRPDLFVQTRSGRYLNPEFAHHPYGIAGGSRDIYFVKNYRDVLWTSEDYLVIQRMELPDRHIEKAVLASGLKYIQSYGHFIYNTLPKLAGLQERGCLDDAGPILMGNRVLPFQQQLLALLGIGPERLATLDDAPLSVGTLRIVEEAPQMLQQYGLFDIMRARIATPERRPRIPRLFVARWGNHRRPVDGDAELAAGLEARGFQVIVPEEHPVAEQIALFDAADTILTFHGSALATLVFSRPGKTVIEIATKTFLSPSILNYLGHRHYVVNSMQNDDSVGAEGGYRLNVPEVLQVVDDILHSAG